MKTSKSILIVAAALIPAAAFALPPMVKQFNTHYNVDKTTALGKANCAACHVGATHKLNPYGADLKAAITTLKTNKKITPEVLKAAEAKDSDKDGVNNLAEIKKGTLPGDPKSK